MRRDRIEVRGAGLSTRVGTPARLLRRLWPMALAAFLVSSAGSASARDLDEVLETGVLRHLGIPYANFVTVPEGGLDVELVRLFAEHLGVRYEFVETSWKDVVADLTGKVVKPRGDEVEILGERPVRGDLVATGFTVLPWRKKVMDFSIPTFPTGVWLVARADSPIQPIRPRGDIEQDIVAVKTALRGRSVLALKDSCLAPELYGLDRSGAVVRLFPGDRNLEEMIPAIMAGMAETTLMDVPVALVALEKWPGEIKVIGPVSPRQEMAYAFPKTSPKLRRAFNAFFRGLRKDGIYASLVLRHYPTVMTYYRDFFAH